MATQFHDHIITVELRCTLMDGVYKDVQGLVTECMVKEPA